MKYREIGKQGESLQNDFLLHDYPFYPLRTGYRLLPFFASLPPCQQNTLTGQIFCRIAHLCPSRIQSRFPLFLIKISESFCAFRGKTGR